MEETIAIEPTLVAIREARAWLEAILAEKELPDQLAADMALVMEEVLANVMDYNALEATARILIGMNLSGQRLELVFEDSGKPFNPLQEIESPDLEADSEQRSAGGFGFFIVQELTDGVEYHHEDGKNRLVVVRLLEKDH